MDTPDAPEPADLDAIQKRPYAPYGGYNLADGPRCGAKTRSDGKCKRHPANGSKRCRFHGGNSPQVIAKHQREQHQQQVEKEIQKALLDLDIRPVENPLTALKLLAGEVIAWKDALLQKVQLLDKLRYSTEFNEQIRGEVLLYERALDKCATVLATIARLNIDERLAAVEERQVKMLEDGLFAAFEAAGIPVTDPDLRETVAVAFGSQLIALPGGRTEAA